jgi:hypothetical protein
MNIITTLLTLSNQIKIYHWQTDSYAAHKALDKAYEKLVDLTDDFIEVFQGKNARIKGKDGFTIKLNNISDISGINEFIDINIIYLTTELENGLGEGYNDELLNIRDEMVATLQQLKYLLTLK